MGDKYIPHFIYFLSKKDRSVFNEERIDMDRLPQHIAIIMDGNGRWAKNKNLPRTQGHVEGVKRVEEIIEACVSLKIKVLTLFTFSTENWSRPEQEVNMLMETLTSVLKNKIRKLKESNIRFGFIGRTEGIPQNVWEIIHYSINETKDNTGLIVNMAFNYGARQEIVDAVKKILEEIQIKKISMDGFSEQMFSRYLYTRNLPDPDLLIRTSGEKRISNFLLWQLSYAELYFTEKCWPEFTAVELRKALVDFQQRERRFGNVSPREA